MYRKGRTLTHKTKKLIRTCGILLLLGLFAALVIYICYLIKINEIKSIGDLFSLIEQNILASGPDGLKYKIYIFLKSVKWTVWHWVLMIFGALFRFFCKIGEVDRNIVDKIALLIYELLLMAAFSGFLVGQNYLLWVIVAVVNGGRFVYYKVDQDYSGEERVEATVALAFTFWLIFAGLHAFNMNLLGGFLEVDFFRIFNWGLLIAMYFVKIGECLVD